MILENGLGGYRYAPETIAAFNDAIDEARQVLAEGKTVFNPSRQAQKIANIKSKFAKADPGLQRLLGAVMGSSPQDSG